MNARQSLGKLIRIVVERCQDAPKRLPHYIDDMADHILNKLDLTEKQQQELIGLWQEYSKEISDIIDPVIEAKVEESHISFTI